MAVGQAEQTSRRPRPADAAPAGSRRISYLLVSNTLAGPPGGSDAGWTLMGYREGIRCWALDLARHGATADTAAPAAQGVAERVLAHRGVTLGAWRAIEAIDDDGGAYWTTPASPSVTKR